MANPKVTVLMSVYNGKKYLRVAIDSILNQTFRDFEFIIINDGSTDRTKEILESYTDERIKIINNTENLGLSKSLNIGIKEAGNDYIFRMDADDISLPERLSKQVRFLDCHEEIAVVGSGCYGIDEDGCIVSLNKVFTEDDQLKRWLSLGAFEAYIWHPSTVIRKEDLLAVGLYNENLKTTQDKDLWIRLAAKGYKFANIPEALLKKRCLPDPKAGIRSKQRKYVNTINVRTLANFRDKYKDLRIPPIPKYKLDGVEKKAYAELYLRLGKDLYSCNQVALARKAFLASIRCFPCSIEVYRYLLSTFSLFKKVKRTIN